MTFRLPDDQANRLLDLFLGDDHDTTLSPATVYVALFEGTESDNDGTGLTEFAVDTYARVAVTNNTTNWPDASGRVKSNGTAITFPSPTADWGTATTWGLYDDATTGDLLITGPLPAPQPILSTSDAPAFDVGDLVVSAPTGT